MGPRESEGRQDSTDHTTLLSHKHTRLIDISAQQKVNNSESCAVEDEHKCQMEMSISVFGVWLWPHRLLLLSLSAAHRLSAFSFSSGSQELLGP